MLRPGLLDAFVNNPNKGGEVALREPEIILDEMVKRDAEIVKIINDFKKII